MPGKSPKKRKSPRRTGAKPPRSARPVLGNDPFQRGAAVRAEAPTAPPPPAKLASAHAPLELDVPRVHEATASPARALFEPGPAAAYAELRERLKAIESRIEASAAKATARLHELARAEESGDQARDLLKTLTRLWPALQRRWPGLGAVAALLSRSGELDGYGMEHDLVARAMPLLEFLYATWWRVDARGMENVPSQGAVVLVANHGGSLPWDALVLRLALLRDHPAHRELRPLLDQAALGMPLVGPMAVRLGAVAATPENAKRLLDEQRAVAVFPEGTSNALRPWPQRYRIERFGRGGFAKLALRTGAPVVPCAVVGSEETSAPFARPGWLSARLGMPFLLSAPALPLGAFGAFPLPSRWGLSFGEALDTRGAGPSAADDPARVLELTERTRVALQEILDREVAARRSVYL
ncbi:MAG TPA: lysophospholipid acyltransferase family protein [Anaeromyxobacteraceae bacterium]|nr:lysophospholipid acyltransferase family protein [Anaeromyxobacteraceae bacterium]